MTYINFVSFNVNGFRSQAKRTKIMEYIIKLKADLFFMQESHLAKSEEKYLSNSNFNLMYSASYNSRQRGVAILVHKRILFTLNNAIADPDGRFIIVQATIYNKLFTLVNIYAPNNDDTQFFHNIFGKLSDMSVNSIIIIGGDFNTTLDPIIDSSNLKLTKQSQTARTLRKYMDDFGLSDVWRAKHLTKREYTFQSLAHRSCSRIDFFLANNSAINNIVPRIHPIIISDHAPISLALRIDSRTTPHATWRFNDSLLDDPAFDTFVKKEWKDFMELNDSPNISPSLLWETGKCVIRGKIISYSSYKKKQEQKLENELEIKIKQLTEEFAKNPTDTITKELFSAKERLNSILSKRTQFLLQQLRYTNFEHNNKSGKYLANQLERNKEKTLITTIQDSAGMITQSPEKINETFYCYYKNLYSVTNDHNEEDIDLFVSNLDIPQITLESQQLLDTPLTLAELWNAVKDMPTGRAPGPDGFSTSYFKHFWNMLAPLFYRMVQEIRAKGQIRDIMNTAVIKLLPKAGKDPTQPANYRPISLMNTDIKIIAKALAARLEQILPTIIHNDQTGFIKGRNSTNNIRRLLNLINRVQNNKEKAIILSLDAEKAFDKVNWIFLFKILKKFGFGEPFTRWIRTFYTAPKATVNTNGVTSQSFCLQRGTRQGCPLSPLLFALFIEPLAIAIRQNTNIKGIRSQTSEHKINLYADDILLYLEKPDSSLHEVFELIKKFSQISDYAINWSKSIVMPLSTNSWNPADQNLNYNIPVGNIKYLGINISPKLTELTKLNHTPLLAKICEDLIHWNNLPISLLGRIATVKMKILPQINYLFAMIPFKPTQKWFQDLDSAVTKFYCKNKKNRISLVNLQRNKSEGGLEAPNFQHYYIANQIQYLIKWLNLNIEQQSWLELEQTDCDRIQLANLPFISPSIKRHSCFKNPMIACTLKAWWSGMGITQSQFAPCKFSPIWHNPDFGVNKIPIYFRTWEETGINQLQHLFKEDTFMSYENIVQDFQIIGVNFLQYNKIRAAIKSKLPSLMGTLDPPPFVNRIVNIHPQQKKILSKVYKAFSCSNSTCLPIEKWSNDLPVTLDNKYWSDICKNTFIMTKNKNLQLIQFKILHRWHITQSKMHKMGFSQSDKCTSCNEDTSDTYFHALWQCKPIQNFWSQVIKKLSFLLNCRIPLSPILCLLGDLNTVNISNHQARPLLASLAIAKKTILLNWKNKQNVSMNQWLNLIIEYITLEKISAKQSNKMDKYEQQWETVARMMNIE